MKNRLTRGNLLATIKELKKHPRPKVANPVPASVQAIVPASNPQPKKSKELARAIAQRRAILSGASSWLYSLSAVESELFDRLTTLQDFRIPYEGEPHGDLFVHWFYRERNIDRLSKCEIFHLNMLQYFNALDKVEVIHIRCASTVGLTDAMKNAIAILSKGKATVDFKIVPQARSWEHDTIKEAVEFAIDTGRFVYYTHFKGVSRIGDSSLGLSVSRHKYGEIDVLYWSYILYASLFDSSLSRGFNGVILRNGVNCSYTTHNYDCSWCVHKRRPNYHYVGSFQSFDGRVLSERFKRLGMSKADRLDRLWVNDPYTVEMFLSLCSVPQETAFTHLGIGIGSYNLYKSRKYRASLYAFTNLYKEKPTVKVKGKYVVLTYLFGKHTLLRDPLFVDKDVEYICISDNPNVVSKTWKILVNPLDYLQDNRLRVAYIKFHPYEFVEAEKVLVLDASYQIKGSILPLFEHTTQEVMLLPHLYRSYLKEELSAWVEGGRMTSAQASWFRSITPYLGGDLSEPLFELSVSVWLNTPMARLLGLETYAVLEYDGFPSNQIPCSLLAFRHFKGVVGAISSECMSGLKKYHHNTWKPCTRQSYSFKK